MALEEHSSVFAYIDKLGYQEYLDLAKIIRENTDWLFDDQASYEDYLNYTGFHEDE